MGEKDKQPEEVAVGEKVDTMNNSAELPKEQKKGKKAKTILLVLLLLVVLLGCCYYFLVARGEKVESNTAEVDTKEVKSDYRMSGNSLENFDLYFLKLENEAKNKVYSPLSIKYALEMLAEGADGDTKAQLDAVIGDYEARKYDNNEHMSFANAMFIRDTFKDSIRKEYTDSLSTKFGAEVITDSFQSANTINSWVSEKTLKLIDKLFQDDEVSELNFVLANALAIDMNWTNKLQCTDENFNPQLTNEIPCKDYAVNYAHEKYSDYVGIITGEIGYPEMTFNGTENIKSTKVGASLNNYDIISDLGEDNIRNTISKEYQEWLDAGNCGGAAENPDVNTYVDQFVKDLGSNYHKVDVSSDFYLYDDEEIKAFAKDLQEYNGMSLQYVGIMPKTAELTNYIDSLDAKKVNAIIENLKEIKSENFKDGVVTKIVGNIPLFKFDYELDLLTDLQKLGIEDIFDVNKANLTKMLSGDTKQYIAKAKHMANIEFSNNGIKAAAVTGMGGRGAASCSFEHLYDVPVETIDITFDKPYMYIIRDKSTGEVWFAGTVYKPIKK